MDAYAYNRKHRELADNAFDKLILFAESLHEEYPEVFPKPVCYYPEDRDEDTIMEVSLYVPSVRGARPSKVFLYNFRIFSNIRLKQRCIDVKNGEEDTGRYPKMELLRADLNVGIISRDSGWCGEVIQSRSGKIYEGLGHFEETERTDNTTHMYDLFVSYPCTKECFKSIDKFLKIAKSHACDIYNKILRDRRPEFDKDREDYIRRHFKLVQDMLVNKT